MSKALADRRLRWLAGHASAMLRIKENRIVSVFNNALYREEVDNFLNLQSCARLLIWTSHQGLKLSTKELPAANPSVLCYFVKTSAVTLTSYNMESSVILGTCSGDVLLHMSAVSHEALLPLLSNPQNQERWHELGGKTMENFHNFLGQTYVLQGRTQGRTLLPLPPLDTNMMRQDRDKIHMLER